MYSILDLKTDIVLGKHGQNQYRLQCKSAFLVTEMQDGLDLIREASIALHVEINGRH